MKTSFFFVIIILISLLQSYAQSDKNNNPDYIIYSTKEGKVVDVQTIVNDLTNYDVLFYGEEHNDQITHDLQLKIFSLMYAAYGNKTVLSMEMFDRDAQYILNEYLNGWIKEGYFTKDAGAWPNYNQYRPLIEFSKANNLQVVAANAPFRYVSLVNKFGIDTLITLSNQSSIAKNAMAPLPYNLASGEYEKKLHDLGKSEKQIKKEEENPDTVNTKKYNVVPGHSLWDATMAYSVYQKHQEKPDSKIMHLNGAFHTEEHFGICQRLAEYDPKIKVLVITSQAKGKDFKKIDFEEDKKLGDYLIYTKSKPE